MQEAGATADLELAYTLADGLEYLRTGIRAGLDIDSFAPRISFFWGIGMNHFMEIAKMRAARVLWAKLVRQLNPKNPKSMVLRAHCQTSGWSLTAQDPFNNVIRTCVEALAAALGHTQSLHTNALDEALALPTDFSARIARNTQIYLQEETGITNVVDPWGGSYYVEKLTHELMHRAWQIDPGGGAIGRHGQGHRNRLAQDAHRRSRRAQTGAYRFRQGHHRGRQRLSCRIRCGWSAALDVRVVDNTAVRRSQIASAGGVAAHARRGRGPGALWRRSTRCAETGEGNLLDLAVAAARNARDAGRNLHGPGTRLGPLPSCDAHYFRRILGGEQDGRKLPEGPPDGG